MGTFVESDGVDEDRAYLIEIEGYKCGGNIIIDYAGSSTKGKASASESWISEYYHAGDRGRESR